MASFKIPAKFKKHFSVAYLYSDGSLVICYRKRDNTTGAPIEWATIHSPDSTGIRVVTADMGDTNLERIIIGSIGALNIVMNSKRVDYWHNNSTPASRDLKMIIRTVCVVLSDQYGDNIDFHEIPGLLHCDVTGQTQVGPVTKWGQIVDKTFFCHAHIINNEYSTL